MLLILIHKIWTHLVIDWLVTNVLKFIWTLLWENITSRNIPLIDMIFFALALSTNQNIAHIFSPTGINTMQTIQVARLHHPTTAKTSRVNRHPLEVPIYTCMSQWLPHKTNIIARYHPSPPGLGNVHSSARKFRLILMTNYPAWKLMGCWQSN